MAKTLRTSGDYTIKAGDGFDSGSGTNTITLDSLDVTINGNLTVGGTSAIVNTTNTTIEDNIIELNTGASANTNNAGIIIERGTAGNNAAIVWKEDTDSFVLGTTTATAADKSTSLTVAAGALEVAALTATTGTFSGAITSVGATIEGNITVGSVTTNEITANGSNAALTVASSGTGDITLDAGGDVIVDVDNADLILKDAGTEFGRFSRVTADFVIKASAQDQDLILKGNDGGSTVTALTFDMSEGGAATFGAGITANSLTTNTITANGSNAGISIQPSGSGELTLGALRLNGTTLDTDDSSAITIGEEVNFQGAVNLSGGDLVTGQNRITFNDQSSGTVAFLDFTVDLFSENNHTVLSSVKSIDFFLDSNGGDSGQAFRIFNNTNPDSSPTESTFIFKVAESGDVTITGDLSAIDITANSLTTNVISSNGSNADLSLQPSGTGDVVVSSLRVNGTTIDSADSTKVTFAEAVDVTGALTGTSASFSTTLAVTGATTISDALTATSIVSNTIASNGSNADITLDPEGTGKVTVNSQLNVASGIDIGLATIDDGTKSTTSSSIDTLDTFVLATHRSAEYTVSMADSTNSRFGLAKLYVTHDGSNAYINSQGISSTGSDMATFTADIDSGNVRIRMVPISADSVTYKFTKTLIEV